MRICVIIPAHAPWHVVELTVGTFLKHHSSHDINMHVGVHLNFCDYTKDYRMFKDLRGIAQVHMTEEINWKAHNDSVYRYSTMHAKNLENLIIHAAYYDWDRIVILDHDLLVKEPFVDKIVKKYPYADIVGAVMSEGLTEFKTSSQQDLYCVPKLSVWHTVLNRKAFDKIMEDPRVIYPRILPSPEKEEYARIYGAKKNLPFFVDTFADVLHRARHQWDLKTVLLKEPDFAEWVRHFSGSSFNYGYRLLGNARYEALMAESQEHFKNELPDGLEPFRTPTKQKKAPRRRDVHSRHKGPHGRADVGASL